VSYLTLRLRKLTDLPVHLGYNVICLDNVVIELDSGEMYGHVYCDGAYVFARLNSSKYYSWGSALEFGEIFEGHPHFICKYKRRTNLSDPQLEAAMRLSVHARVYVKRLRSPRTIIGCSRMSSGGRDE
jgi:hypothetical protein